MSNTDDSLKGLYALAEIWREEVKRAIAAEREACAMIADQLAERGGEEDGPIAASWCREVGEDIRARGQT